MYIEEAIKELKSEVNDSKECRYIDLVGDECVEFFQLIETLLIAYEKEKEKNKNKDKILRNIREEFLKYDWKNANPIQTYNQIKSLYESIYCKPYEE